MSISLTLGSILFTHSVDARQLLRELEDYSDDDRLTVVWGAEEFEDGHFLLRGHLHPFFLHLLNIIAHVLTAAQTHQRYREKKGWMNGEQAGTLLCKKDGRTSCNGLGTSCGQTLINHKATLHSARS